MKKIKVLDNGFVRLVDHMGGDHSVVQAARVSYGAGTKTKRDDRKLIRYLMRHHHTTPFEMVVFKFHMRMPIFVARQFIRHRTASVNEYSGRYSEMPTDYYTPTLDRVAAQATDNKQGSGDNMPQHVARKWLGDLTAARHQTTATYEAACAEGIARELARIDLPLSTYTEWYWQMDLKNLLHFLRLRCDKHAQQEARQYAEAIASIVETIVPTTYEAWVDYQQQAATLSAKDRSVLAALLAPQANELRATCQAAGYSERDILELMDKLCISS